MRETNSSPRRNSEVRAKYSRDRLAERIPPYNSLSLTVPNVDLLAVLYIELHESAYSKTEHRTHLEGKVFQYMRDTRLGFVSASGLNEEGDSGRGLTVVDCGDLDPGTVDDSGEAAREGRRSSCKHL